MAVPMENITSVNEANTSVIVAKNGNYNRLFGSQSEAYITLELRDKFCNRESAKLAVKMRGALISTFAKILSSYIIFIRSTNDQTVRFSKGLW